MHPLHWPLTNSMPSARELKRPDVTRAGLRLPSFPEHAVSVRYATEHRCGVAVRGPGLSDAISGTDPLRDNLALRVRAPHAAELGVF